MLLYDNLKVNNDHHLTINGHDAVELAKKYGTPLYVIDDDRMRNNMRVYKNAVDKYYDGKGIILFANKALCTKHTFKVAAEEGLGCDVVSGGEIYTAKSAGFPMEKLFFHGNNKTYDEIVFAVESGVGHFVVDNIYELETLDKVAREHNVVQNILFRIKPGIDAHTHSFVRTGQIDSKFGVALENGEVYEILDELKRFPNVKLDGLHCHIASSVFDVKPFCEAAEVMMNLIGEIKRRYGIEIDILNLGGGFGVPYTSEDATLSYDAYIEAVSKTLKEVCAKNEVKMPMIAMEPGRSIVADTGVTLYTIGGIKDIKDIRKYVSVDGGMCDNPRYILYQSVYTMLNASRADAEADDTVTIAGKCCESGDLVGEGVKIAKPQVGDVLAVLTTGAYNYSMASNYNRIPKPAMVAVTNDSDRLVVKRETYEQLVQNDVD